MDKISTTFLSIYILFGGRVLYVDVSRHTYATTEAIKELEPKTSLSVGNWQVKSLKKLG